MIKRIELEVEHNYDNKYMGRHVLKPNELVTIGSSRDATIRLLGEQVAIFHAALEFDQDSWTLSDLHSEHGTWVRKKPVVEHYVNKEVIVQIGSHTLKLVPKEIKNQLFDDGDQLESTSVSSHQFHQVIVRKRGLVVDALMFSKNQNFIYDHDGKSHTLPPPSSHQWVTHQFDDVTVQQRIVGSNKVVSSRIEKIKSFIDPSLKMPMIMGLLLFFLIGAMVFFAPAKDEAEMAEVMKPQQNKYTRLIFDAKSMKNQQTQAKKLQSNLVNKMEKSAAAPKTPEQKAYAKKLASAKTVVKVVNRLKTSGLTNLIGKISKRSINTARLIQSNGQEASMDSTSRALASIGSTSVGGNTKDNNKKYRVQGVATGGKGAGKSSLTGIGGLATGSIGSSSVGIIDEETVIQGGLARDVISKVINANLGQIRYCYERQLSVSPDLYGKLQVQFTIGPDGDVVSQGIGSSSLKNSMVEGCVLRRVSSWRFPKPKGGTQVNVKYPFLFKSTN